MKTNLDSKKFDLTVIVKDFLRKLPNIEIELVRTTIIFIMSQNLYKEKQIKKV